MKIDLIANAYDACALYYFHMHYSAKSGVTTIINILYI